MDPLGLWCFFKDGLLDTENGHRLTRIHRLTRHNWQQHAKQKIAEFLGVLGGKLTRGNTHKHI